MSARQSDQPVGEEHRDGDAATHRRFAEVAATLYVGGLGIDATRPRG